MKHVYAISLLLVLSACSADRNSSKKLTLTSQKNAGIIGGKYVPEKSSIAASTVGIYDSENEFACTGTLLTTNIVITAAHCAETKPANLKIIFGSELSATLNAREVDVQMALVRKASAVKVHPNWKNDESQPNEWHDIALIKFQGSLPQGYQPANVLADPTLLTKGTTITMAGYGATHARVTNINEKKFPNLNKAVASGEIVCEVDEDDLDQHCYKIDFEGDDDLLMTTATIESQSPSEIRSDESHGHGTCVGDSGGPAFVLSGGDYYFFGITSRGSYACDGYGVYTNALYFKNWIDENIMLLNVNK